MSFTQSTIIAFVVFVTAKILIFAFRKIKGWTDLKSDVLKSRREAIRFNDIAQIMRKRH